VVLENIHRKRQEGLAPEQAAEQGARDVVLPILAATLTTLIVFAPFVYFRGEMAIYYLPLAVVVALTLLASLIVAFTFIPALAARLLRRGRAFGAAPPAQAQGTTTAAAASVVAATWTTTRSCPPTPGAGRPSTSASTRGCWPSRCASPGWPWSWPPAAALRRQGSLAAFLVGLYPLSDRLPGNAQPSLHLGPRGAVAHGRNGATAQLLLRSRTQSAGVGSFHGPQYTSRLFKPKDV
jgi:hypothetical protein